MATLTVPDPTAVFSKHTPQSLKHECAHWLGRQVHVLHLFLKEFCHGIAAGAKKVLQAIARVFSDACSLGRVCRLGVGTLTVIERIVGRPGIFTAAAKAFASTDSITGTISVLDQVQYFGTQQHRKKPVLETLGNGALYAAGTIGVITLIGRLILMGLSKAGSVCNLVPGLKVFSILGRVSAGIAAAGFSFFSLQSIHNIVDAKTKQEKVHAWLNLAWNIAELAFAIFAVAACASLIGGIVLGSTAAILGISSFLYGKHVEDQKAKIVPHQSKTVTI